MVTSWFIEASTLLSVVARYMVILNCSSPVRSLYRILYNTRLEFIHGIGELSLAIINVFRIRVGIDKLINEALDSHEAGVGWCPFFRHPRLFHSARRQFLEGTRRVIQTRNAPLHLATHSVY
jgi:hypothetical protein